MKKLSYPADENEFDKKAVEMRFLNAYKKSNRGIGAKTKTQPEKVVIRDTKTSKRYGSRTLIQKATSEAEVHEPSELILLNSLLEGDYSALPNTVIAELQKLIRKGAADLEQQWANALELVHKAYQVANVRRPIPEEKAAWQQYEDLIAYAVKQLYNTRGIDGKWRLTSPAVSDILVAENLNFDELNVNNSKSKKRFFVEIPDEGNAEIEANNLDEIVDFIMNKLKNSGVVARIKEKDENVVVLTVWTDNVKRDEIIIKKID